MAEELDQGIETSPVERHEYERTISWVVRISVFVLSALLVIFFIVVIRTTSIISSQVEYVRESLYPISVASGHIETELVHLQTFIENESSHQLGGEIDSKQSEENALNEIMTDLHKQMDIIKETSLSTDYEVTRMDNLLNLLDERITTFFKMGWEGEVNRDRYKDLKTYTDSYLNPVIELMLQMNDDVLDETSNKIETMYTEVNRSISVLFYFTIGVSIAVVVVSVILLIVINIKGRLERQLSASLEDALKETKQANEAKSAFMANMSHDIRTPMNAIVGLTQIAIENIDDPVRVRQCLTRITTSSQHLLSLINDVLDMNKIESGKVTLSKEVFSLTSLANEIETLFQSQPKTSSRKSDVVIKNLYADLLYGDAMRLRQILLNLVSNALKYTNEGDVAKLTIEEKSSSRPNYAEVIFVVEDTGIGMKQEFIKRIFEPFERENNDFTIFTEGTGLGMAITKNLVDLMGGTIKVESDLGIGTKVTICIDFEIAPDDRTVKDSGNFIIASEEAGLLDKGDDAQDSIESDVEKDKNIKPVDKKPSTKNPNKLSVKGNVLIVEDNDINMEIAKQLIGSRGATVYEAYDGLEAVKKVSCSKEGDYDLIFMDWQMPHMNGIEATKSIRKFFDEHGRKQVPIVAMTANAFDSDKKMAIEAGMNDFMAKPINIHQLEDVLKRYLSSDA